MDKHRLSKLGYLGFLGFLGPIGLILYSSTDNDAFGALMGMTVFFGFFGFLFAYKNK